MNIQEKVTESWKKLIKVSEFMKHKVVIASQPDDRLSVASGRCCISLSSFGLWSGKNLKFGQGKSGGKSGEKSGNFRLKSSHEPVGK